MSGPRLGIIAGEPSGDQLGYKLMRALRAERDVDFIGVGGEAMTAEGLSSFFPMSDIAVMGVAAVVARLPLLLRRIRETAEALIAARPDALIIIDSPDFTHRVARRVRKALPGPFTFILEATSAVPHFFQSKKKTVGIRIPDHTVPVGIVEMLGNPIMTTSIHSEDEIEDYLTDPELIHEKFKKMVDIVIDSGHCGNVPSTVVDCTGEELEVIRPGKGDIWQFSP